MVAPRTAADRRQQHHWGSLMCSLVSVHNEHCPACPCRRRAHQRGGPGEAGAQCRLQAHVPAEDRPAARRAGWVPGVDLLRRLRCGAVASMFKHVRVRVRLKLRVGFNLRSASGLGHRVRFPRAECLRELTCNVLEAHSCHLVCHPWHRRNTVAATEETFSCTCLIPVAC